MSKPRHELSCEQVVVTVQTPTEIQTKQKLPYFVGISKNTAGATGISMNLVVIPPGATAEPHYHKDFETGIYVLEGRVETLFGARLERSVVNGPGDFIFIPPGLPHQPTNLDLEAPAKAIVVRNDPNEQENVVPYQVPGEEADS
jgi:uncharacterized RmlC-like cupin family protein